MYATNQHPGKGNHSDTSGVRRSRSQQPQVEAGAEG